MKSAPQGGSEGGGCFCRLEKDDTIDTQEARLSSFQKLVLLAHQDALCMISLDVMSQLVSSCSSRRYY